MWKKVDQYVKKHHMIASGDKILLGLSGGADSMALARYLLILKERKEIDLYAVHINHQLRGEEAKRDEDFVRAFCEKWQIPHKVSLENVSEYAKEQKLSLEEAGRELRYARMEEYALETGCGKIALAHHADDLAETMIFRMVRGTGPEGLTGILPVNGNRIRPMLGLSKMEILEILKNLDQLYVEDSSNQETEYRRNYIRSYILPPMKEINGQALSHMMHLSEQLNAQNVFVKKQLDHIYEEQVVRKEKQLGIAISFLKKEDAFTKHEIIRRMFFEICGKRRDFTATHVDIIGELVRKENGKYNDLPYDMVAMQKDGILWMGHKRDFLAENAAMETADFFLEIPREILEKEACYHLKTGQEEEIIFNLSEDVPEEIPKNDCIKYFDYDKIKCMLCIRTRKEGDYLVLDASGRKKKLRRYFIDEKIPAYRRDQILLLADGAHILCIDGDRISEDYKVTEVTKRVLRVKYPKK